MAEAPEHTVAIQKDVGMETRELFHHIAAVELYQAQIEIAQYLELAYLGVAEFPDVAKEVRMTAHTARTQHMMSSGLMKNFMVTAGHIVRTMIPMILDAVDLEDQDIIKESFGQIIKLAEDMKKEAADTKQKYYEIQTMVQNNLALVDKKNKDVVDEQERLRVEVAREKSLARDAQLAQEELEVERKKMGEELETLRSYRDKWMEQTSSMGQSMGGRDETFLDPAMIPTPSIWGTIAAGAVNLIGGLLGRNKKETRMEQMMEGLRDSQDRVEKTAAANRKVLTNLQERRKDKLQRLQKVKELNLQTASLGDAASLAEAAAKLGDVDRQFTRIIIFWENMVAMLKFLQSDTQAGEVYLTKIKKPKHAERFKLSITRAEKSWKWFGRVCGDYVKSCEKDEHIGINALYSFLSAPIDHKTSKDRQLRMRELENDIEENIHQDISLDSQMSDETM